MARIDVKGLYKRVEALKAAAIAYSDAAGRVSKTRPNSLRVAERDDAYRDLEATAIDLVRALLVADDGKDFRKADRDGWWKHLQANRDAVAAVFDLVKKTPYAAIFERAESEASHG